MQETSTINVVRICRILLASREGSFSSISALGSWLQQHVYRRSAYKLTIWISCELITGTLQPNLIK
jgi:hypothetical protein